MKKTLVLASLLAAFGAASAQSSVTLGGTTGFGYQRDGAARDQSLGEVDFSLTVKGTEQLGGGLAASFSVELDNSNASFRQLNSYAAGSTPTTATAQGSDRQGVRRGRPRGGVDVPGGIARAGLQRPARRPRRRRGARGRR